MVTRRFVLSAGIGTALAAATGVWAARASKPVDVGAPLSPDDIAAAMVLLARHPAIDSHAHPGRTFVLGAEHLAWQLRLYQMFGHFEERVAADMLAGGVAAASFSGVADFPVLDIRDGGLVSVRAFAPGEAWTYYRRQIDNLKALVARGIVHPVLVPDDIAAARAAGKPGAIFAVEGADFVEDDPSRIATAHADGVRMVTLVHYLAGGKLGDIMTAPPVTGGITDLGRAVVREMQRVGIVVDLSHASEKTAFDALAIGSKPMVATHTHTNQRGVTHARFISPKLARAVADSGGYIGAWPAGIGISTLGGMVDRIFELIEDVGIDHVAIGSDMDANYKPVFDNYRQMPAIVAALLRRGMRERDIAQIIGGNFQRVFAAHTA